MILYVLALYCLKLSFYTILYESKDVLSTMFSRIIIPSFFIFILLCLFFSCCPSFFICFVTPVLFQRWIITTKITNKTNRKKHKSVAKLWQTIDICSTFARHFAWVSASVALMLIPLIFIAYSVGVKDQNLSLCKHIRQILYGANQRWWQFFSNLTDGWAGGYAPFPPPVWRLWGPRPYLHSKDDAVLSGPPATGFISGMRPQMSTKPWSKNGQWNMGVIQAKVLGKSWSVNNSADFIIAGTQCPPFTAKCSPPWQKDIFADFKK